LSSRVVKAVHGVQQASHLEKVYRDRVGKVSLPITEAKARSTMLIPLFATMTDDEQTYAIESLREELAAA
jgi:dTDP-4-amino-4,6-dideoxygalactose transaminase